jgi:transcription termination/antitermination protein NusG
MNQWFVLYVKSGFEDEIAHKINEQDSVNAFVPRKIKLYKRQGKLIKVNDIVFKSYVFVETDMDYETFHLQVINKIKVHSAFFKTLLHKEDKNIETLYPTEKELLLSLMNKDRFIEPSIGFVEGDKVTIISGPLVGKESIIQKINKHKRIAILEVELMGRQIEMQIPLEIIFKNG